jgi:hypothetical protein
MTFRLAVAGDQLHGFSGIPRHLVPALREYASVSEWHLPAYRPSFASRAARRLARTVSGKAYLAEKDPARCAFLSRAIDARASREAVDAILVIGSEAAAFCNTGVPLFAFGDSIFGSRVNLYADQMLERVQPGSIRDGIQVQQRALDRLRCLFITSRFAIDRAVEEFGYRVDSDRIEVTLAGANLPHVGEPPPPVTELRLLWVGVDWIRKRGDVAVSAVSHLRASGLDARLDVAGVDVGSAGPWMTVHGRLDASELAKAYSQASALLLPTTADLTPLVVAEAAMFGRTVFATRVGGIPEMIRDGEEGVLIPSYDPAAWADAIGTVVKAGELARLGGGARARYEKSLNWRGIAGRMVQRMRTAL